MFCPWPSEILFGRVVPEETGRTSAVLHRSMGTHHWNHVTWQGTMTAPFFFRFEYLVNTAVRKDSKSKTSWDWKGPLEFILSKQDQEGLATLNPGLRISPHLTTPQILWAVHASVWPPFCQRGFLLVCLFFIEMPKAWALAVPFIVFVGCIIQILTSQLVQKGREWKEIAGNLQYEQLWTYYYKIWKGLAKRLERDYSPGHVVVGQGRNGLKVKEGVFRLGVRKNSSLWG